MSLFIIPRKVSSRLENIQKDFLWGSRTLEIKPHLVNGNLVRVNKKEGGLEICRLFALNKALLKKRSWRFVDERGAPMEVNHY